MPYEYKEQLKLLPFDRNVSMLIHVKDTIDSLVDNSGAFLMSSLLQKFKLLKFEFYGNWDVYACVDYLVDLGYLHEYKPNGQTPLDMFRVFISKKSFQDKC